MQESWSLLGYEVNKFLSRMPPPQERIINRIIWGEDEEMNSEIQKWGRQAERQKGGHWGLITKVRRRTSRESVSAVPSVGPQFGPTESISLGRQGGWKKEMELEMRRRTQTLEGPMRNIQKTMVISETSGQRVRCSQFWKCWQWMLKKTGHCSLTAGSPTTGRDLPRSQV